MNKYQEALDTVKDVREFETAVKYPIKNVGKLYKKECDTLQELVDRATPKKVLNRYTYNADGGERVENGECPNCHKAMVRTMDIESSFCDHCGQALDWSDEK